MNKPKVLVIEDEEAFQGLFERVKEARSKRRYSKVLVIEDEEAFQGLFERVKEARSKRRYSQEQIANLPWRIRLEIQSQKIIL